MLVTTHNTSSNYEYAASAPKWTTKQQQKQQQKQRRKTTYYSWCLFLSLSHSKSPESPTALLVNIWCAQYSSAKLEITRRFRFNIALGLRVYFPIYSYCIRFFLIHFWMICALCPHASVCVTYTFGSNASSDVNKVTLMPTRSSKTEKERHIESLVFSFFGVRAAYTRRTKTQTYARTHTYMYGAYLLYACVMFIETYFE